MTWRSIGPYRGGRSVAVAGHPDQPYTYYFGGTGGGVWKSGDGGMTWLNISDGFFKTGSVGYIAVAESDPNVIYVGMGESAIRGNISYGDGVYKSVDAGKTWTHLGLQETHFIGRVAVHPKNADIVYVAALGHVFGPNKERGVYRSMDGGKTWKNVLFKDDKTGAIDIVLDPRNPRVVYASMWECYRNPWSMSSGGPGSSLYQSTDGGDTWTEITKNPGLPKGIVGKIGLSCSSVKDGLVWAIVENENGGVFRSDDAGKTWTRTNESRDLRQRAWYYTRIFADTKNPDAVYVVNVQFHKSIDGGKTFKTMSSQHGDHHDLWIDPRNADRMILADDGGAVVTYNGGQTWTDQDQATAQFYHVAVDNQFPYHVFGTQQDNSSVEILSRTTSYGIDTKDWWTSAGCECGYITPHPTKPNVTFGGCYAGYLGRYDRLTGQEQNIMPWQEYATGGANESKFRFQWTFPIVISPHDPNVLYVTAQNVFRSTDEGMSWTMISSDLTRNDASKQVSSGGPITKDNTTVEFYNTIFAFAESPKEKGVLWAGSDDGLIHISRDNGQSWQNVSIKDFGEGLISIIELSTFDAGTAYVAATKYKFNDFQPYLYKTDDYGKTWKRINDGIPVGAYTRVIRHDPNRKGLLYAGTETGVYVSFNDGDAWQPLQMNLPVVPVHDLAVQAREMDLVAATHGRAFWILDDLSPLYQISDDIAKSETFLFKPRHTYRIGGFQFKQDGVPVGVNPPNGVLIYFYFKDKPKEEVKLEFLDADGKSIITYSSNKDQKGKTVEPSKEFYENPKPKETRMDIVPADTGMNLFVWDMRYPDAIEVPGAIYDGGNLRGPKIIPGTYQVRLTNGKTVQTQSFEIKKDPRIATTQESFKALLDLLLTMQSKLNEVQKGINSVRDIRKQMNAVTASLKDTTLSKSIKDAAKPLNDSLTAIEEALIQTKLKASQDALNYPIKLNDKLVSLMAYVAQADERPAKQSYETFDDLARRIDAALIKLKPLTENEVPKFNALVKDKISAITLEKK
ncbi:glycosyl hydrolase [bacterium]|nr:glycosyl hydrolase [bacterium]